VTVYVYAVAAWLVLIGSFGIVRSRNLIHAVVCVSITQSGTYLMLLSVGFKHGGAPPIMSSAHPPAPSQVVDPVVQAMTLTDIVVSATVTALLLSLAIQLHKRLGTLDPDMSWPLKG
jgi:multicomponent Na+:H+ antiporter subunit C